MWQRTVWLFGSFLVLCTISSKSEDSLDVLKQYIDFLDEQDQKFVDMKNSRDNEMIRKRDWPGDEIDSHEYGCWRYCVKTKISDRETVNEESIKRINIIWNVVDDPEVTLAGKTSNIWGIFTDQDKNLQWESSLISSEKLNIFYANDPKCELTLEIGCRTEQLNSSFSSVFNGFTIDGQKELVSKSDGINVTSTFFYVEEDIEKLRILAFGKLSQVVIGIPIAQGENNSPITRRTRPMFSLSRTSDAEGFVVDARNPSPGEWRLNLSGMENLNYNFSVTSTSSKKRMEYSSENNAPMTIAMPMNNEEDMSLSEMLLRPQRMAYPDAIDDDNSTRVIKRNDEQQLKNEEKLRNQSQNVEQSARNASSGRALTFGSNETNLRRNANLEAEFMEPGTNGKINHSRINENARILANSELSELSQGIDEPLLKKKTVVDIHPDTDLIVDPGVFHDVVFTVTNNQPLEIRYTFRGSSQQFPYVTVIPNEFWIRAGETIDVAVRIQVPNLEQTEPNTVTLYARGNENFEVVEKSTYVYVRSFDGRTTTDSDKPSIDYSFNDNCAGKLNRDRCSRNRWSVEITVSDTGAGLKRVSSVPNGVEPLTEFIGGTKQKTIFYYSATCCYTTVDISATDLQGNSNTQRIDVTAWDNLSPGEIAAIVLGSLLILLLLIFIILALICCIRKRKSHDLSYSQRYGSRSPANAERSNF